MEGMLTSLYSLKLFTDNLKGAVVEKLHRVPIAFGIHSMHGTLDLKKQKKVGKKKLMIDLKTTSQTTEAAFIKKAIKLAYPRQGEVYEELDTDIDESIFIGISKVNTGTKHKPKHPLFIFDLNNYAKERQEATEEAKFLLKFYKDYGVPVEHSIHKSLPKSK